jgi:GTP-binding protein
MRSLSFSSTSTAKASEQLVDHDTADAPAKNKTERRRSRIRNVAVIAHVDHGKTTLVDQLIRLSLRPSLGEVASTSISTTNSEAESRTAAASASAPATAAAAVDRLMDSGDLERERGITITSKVTRLVFDGGPLIVNCVDTPGHSDFSAEVDRILSMVDGVVLVVDVVEGPKSQTKYVLTRALSLGLQPLVVLNKCDRGDDALALIDSGETEDKISKLFHTLRKPSSSPDDTPALSYRTLYASAKEGWITEDPMDVFDLVSDSTSKRDFGFRNLIDAIFEDIPAPLIRTYSDAAEEAAEGGDGDAEDETAGLDRDPFSLAAVSVGYDPYLGRVCTGRIVSGSIRINDPVALIKRDETASSSDEAAAAAANKKGQRERPSGSITGIFVYEGIQRVPLLGGTAYAGEIVTLAGVPHSISVGDTITSRDNPVPDAIETPPLAPPTLSMEFGANTGPLAGLEGSKVASSQVRDRLMAEADNNVTLQVQKSQSDPEKTVIYARGELQLGILVETMRREGFELVISPPRIITKQCPDTGHVLEPFEEVMVDVDTEYASAVVSSLTGDRKGILLESTVSTDGKTHLVFEVPSRGLLGFQSEIATATKGSAVVNHIFIGHQEHAGNLGAGLGRGKLVSSAAGKATSYALSSLESRGVLFIEPSDLVYPGMVIGQNAKNGDLEVNPVRAKEKSNVRYARLLLFAVSTFLGSP